MAKSINLGNGNVLVGLDRYGQLKDLYYHYAGMENHVSEALVHKIGVWVDGRLYWFDDPVWQIVVESEKDTMASLITVTSLNLGIKINISDVVYNEDNIFIRKFIVENLYDVKRKIKFMFNQQFNIEQTSAGDTALYDPEDKVVIHYKGRRVFLINCDAEAEITEYSIGLLGIEGKMGTYKDAEDGELSKNPIEHGKVDSVIAVNVEVDPKSTREFYYWMTIAKSIGKVKKLNRFVKERSPKDIVQTTKDYWRAWVNNQNFSFYSLNDPEIELFRKSLLTIRTHVSKNGAIIASGDSSMLQYGRDTYAYVWPRDAAVAAVALAKAGDFNASRRFFDYCTDIISPKGFFMHKYRPDKSLGSSWHPWIRNGEYKLPIQEDETALVLDALWTYFELSKDLEFIEGIYNILIKPPAEFMCSYRDKDTGLPGASYDLWEEKWGINTFTSSSVYGALSVAGKFASLLGKAKNASRYYTAAQEIKDGIMKYLYSSDEGIFYKLVKDNNERTLDKTMDISSVYGIYRFNVLPVDDEKLAKAFGIFKDRLWVDTEVGGIARYEGDVYHFFGGNIPGNPWIITTLWYVQYLIDQIKSQQDLPNVTKFFVWTKKMSLPSGVLPEQVNPYTGEAVSAAPLVWSHAEYVIAVIRYLEKLEKLGICKACYALNSVQIP